MAYTPHQIGEDPQTKAIRDLSKQMERAIKLLGTIASNTVTTTTTVAP